MRGRLMLDGRWLVRKINILVLVFLDHFLYLVTHMLIYRSIQIKIARAEPPNLFKSEDLIGVVRRRQPLLVVLHMVGLLAE